MSLFYGVYLCTSKHSFLMPFPFRAITALFAAQASCSAFSTSAPFFSPIIFIFYGEDEGSRLFQNDGTYLTKLHSVASLRTVIFTQKLNYLLGF
jgi:hypothetical protein